MNVRIATDLQQPPNTRPRVADQLHVSRNMKDHCGAAGGGKGKLAYVCDVPLVVSDHSPSPSSVNKDEAVYLHVQSLQPYKPFIYINMRMTT